MFRSPAPSYSQHAYACYLLYYKIWLSTPSLLCGIVVSIDWCSCTITLSTESMFWTILRGHFYHPQTNFAKVMFLHLSVSHSVHGGGGVCPSACSDKPPGPEADTPPGPEADTPQEQTLPPTQCMLGDTHNKRAVRIPLECILVKFVGGRQTLYKQMKWTNK